MTGTKSNSLPHLYIKVRGGISGNSEFDHDMSAEMRNCLNWLGSAIDEYKERKDTLHNKVFEDKTSYEDLTRYIPGEIKKDVKEISELLNLIRTFQEFLDEKHTELRIVEETYHFQDDISDTIAIRNASGEL